MDTHRLAKATGTRTHAQEQDVFTNQADVHMLITGRPRLARGCNPD